MSKEMKKMLTQAWDLEEGLMEFCHDCLKEIYGDDSDVANSIFDEGVEWLEHNGCIQPFSIVKQRMEKIKKEQQ